MSVLNIDAGSIFPKAIRIGYEGENVVTQIDFNLKEWIAEYGLGGVTLLVQRHGDIDAYPVPLMIKDGIASWSITQTDTAKSGRGAIQLVYTASEKIKKSPILDVSCLNSLDDSDTVPDPYDSWLATLTDLSTLVTAKVAESLVNADVSQMAANISAQAASSAQSAQTAEGNASASASAAATSATNSAASAQSAASSAQTATDNATLATNKAQAASESASLATAKASAAATSETNAATSAQTATAKASEAAASATSAQEYDESAQASAVNAQGSATAAAASEAQAQEYAENASAYLMTDNEATGLLNIAKGVA